MNKQSKVLSIIFSCAIVANAQTSAGRPSPPPNSDTAPVAQAPKATPPVNKAEDCGCEMAAPDVLAIVNGVKISGREIDEQIKEELEAIKGQVIEARRRELDLQINSKLLEAEARRRGITPIKLLEQEVIAMVKEPTEADAQAFYNQHKNQAAPEF